MFIVIRLPLFTHNTLNNFLNSASKLNWTFIEMAQAVNGLRLGFQQPSVGLLYIHLTKHKIKNKKNK